MARISLEQHAQPGSNHHYNYPKRIDLKRLQRVQLHECRLKLHAKAGLGAS